MPESIEAHWLARCHLKGFNATYIFIFLPTQWEQFPMAMFSETDMSFKVTVSLYSPNTPQHNNVSLLCWWCVGNLCNAEALAEWHIYIHLNSHIQYWLPYIGTYITHNLQIPPLCFICHIAQDSTLEYEKCIIMPNVIIFPSLSWGGK